MATPTSQALRQEREQFTQCVQAALGPRVRIRLDAEGWPYCPAQHGRLEWRGQEPDGTERLYAYTYRARMIRPLQAVPGVRRVQTGDTEAVVSCPAEAVAMIQAVAAVLRTRTRRAPETGRYRPREPRPDAVPGAGSAPEAAGNT